MSFFNWLFGKNETTKQSNIRFGRYTDAYKTPTQLEFWEKSRLAFEQNDFHNSCLALLSYIRDEKEDNVKWKTASSGKIEFEIIQGSQKVTGYFDNTFFEAETAVAKANDLNIGLLRRLIDHSTTLSYSAYALSPDDIIVIRFSSNAPDGSPYKIFHGIKEIATHADKQDDLLLHDFDVLKIVDETLRLPIPEAEKEIKYGYLSAIIQKAFDSIDNSKINLDQQPKTASYILLDAMYKIEYLVAIEGVTMDVLEKAQYQYFSNDQKNLQQKNTNLRKALQSVLELPKEKVLKDMYCTRSTFGVMQVVSHDTFIQHLDGEIPQIDWFYRNNHLEASEAVANNIVGFCLMNCTLPKPDKQLLHLYYETIENNFVKNLGIHAPYTNTEGIVTAKGIQTAFQQIIDENKTDFPYFKPNTDDLDFSSSALFTRSYLMMMRGLDLRKV